jgi:NADH:ubiquinone oxidoreductase subunit F (NADH-binding)/(2Fe-2S) ferredoxin/Pyruvate/2-oxoacid:ferredoxin oxidoreductase delta subunit
MGKVYERHILICAGTGCISSGAIDVRDALLIELNKHDLDNKVRIIMSGCHGFCEQGPIFIVYPDDVFYCGVQAEDVPELVEEHLVKGNNVERLLYKDPVSEETVTSHDQIMFYNKQLRLALRNCGVIDPENIDEYIIRGGYIGLKKALQMEPASVVEEVKKSGLRGRGGAGFPTGRKWQFASDSRGSKKYIVCNADEGDPGAFMDRSILEGDPHAVLEGMLIAGQAIGADEGYIYVRSEYPLAIKRLRTAIAQAEEYGMLGENILGFGFNFKIKIKEGAGAFVCGEETALLKSIEGNRGVPRHRPPFPAVEGLWGKPTCINNVETLANVPLILRRGAEAFASVGTEGSKGTKVFALTGKVNNTGLVEVPMGVTIRDVVFDIGGGIRFGKKFKAAQIGGPSGGCIPEEHLDLPIDFDSLTAAGAMMGSGGLVVVDEDTCMVDMARYFLNFTKNESCGQCIPCRLGTDQMFTILEDITQGRGKMEDIKLLEELALTVKKSSMCGLGQTAPNPVLTTIRYFRDEYEAHVLERRCPALVCKALLQYNIDAEKCIGCQRCIKACPVDAISGEKKEPHEIDQEKCTSCGACYDVCPKKVGAVQCVSEGLPEAEELDLCEEDCKCQS